MSSDLRPQKAPELLIPSGKKEPAPSPRLLGRISLDCNGFDTRVIGTNRESAGAHLSGCGPDGLKYEKGVVLRFHFVPKESRPVKV